MISCMPPLSMPIMTWFWLLFIRQAWLWHGLQLQ